MLVVLPSDLKNSLGEVYTVRVLFHTQEQLVLTYQSETGELHGWDVTSRVAYEQ